MKLHKVVLFLVVVSIVAMLVVFSNKKESSESLGVNLPNRCEFYDQYSSRSVKDVIKAGSGTVFSYKVVSTGTNLKHFHLHDISTLASAGSTNVDYSVPLNTTTASASPVIVEEKFAVPMKFDNGIVFALSTTFGGWGSVAQGDRNSYFVSVCYE